MEVEQRLRERAARLTPSERRIAETILAGPQVVAFGTVADLAAASGAGTATVVRFAVKLGFDGYSELQASIRHDLTRQLRPAAERIRDEPTTGGARCATGISPPRSPTSARRWRRSTRRRSKVRWRCSPTVSARCWCCRGGVARCGDAVRRRPRTAATGVSAARRQRDRHRAHLALVGAEATVVALDLRRYERWLIDAQDEARANGAADRVDHRQRAVAARPPADHSTFVVEAASAGPFDSHVGTLALLDLLVADVATALRSSATDRLDRLEAAWQRADALTDD
jgi:DNA-binding MurR/RpiR family transcriptional regulator